MQTGFFYFLASILFSKPNPKSLGFHSYGSPCLGLLALSSTQSTYFHAAACVGKRPRTLHLGPAFPRPSFKQWTNSSSTPRPYLSKANLALLLYSMKAFSSAEEWENHSFLQNGLFLSCSVVEQCPQEAPSLAVLTLCCQFPTDLP